MRARSRCATLCRKQESATGRMISKKSSGSAYLSKTYLQACSKKSAEPSVEGAQVVYTNRLAKLFQMCSWLAEPATNLAIQPRYDKY